MDKKSTDYLYNVHHILRDRARASEDYYEEYYEGKEIHNADETDNQSWEIGFYAGIQFGLEEISNQIERIRTEQIMLGKSNESKS